MTAVVVVDTIVKMKLFGTSGIRFKASTELVTLAFKLGFVLGNKNRTIVIGTDARTSSGAIKNALLAGLCATGCRCFDAGMVPTPTVAFIARDYDAGIMVTASHNPPEYNGIKIFNPDGSSLGIEQKMEIESAIEKNEMIATRWDLFTSAQILTDAVTRHQDYILGFFEGKYKIKVVLDCGGGAGSSITAGLLRQMGCEVIELFCQPDGLFPRPSEPLEENLAVLKQSVIDNRAALGLAHDGDADRLMVVDEQGKYISGDRLLLILAGSLKAKQVVTTVDASQLVEKYCQSVRRTPVGDNYVSRMLKEWGDFGGETSGSWLFPQISFCPDGVFAAAQMAKIATVARLSDTASRLSEYPIIRGSVKKERSSLPLIVEKLKELDPIQLVETDGARLVFDQAWLLIRASGTEEKLRLTVEAVEEKVARTVYNQAMDIINSVDLSSGEGR